MAPMLVVASIAIAVCGMFGMQEATRSPGRRRGRELRGQDADAVPEFRPGQAGQRRGLRLVVEGVLPGLSVPQHVLRVVQPGTGEPVGAGHGPGAEDRLGRRRGLDAAVVPDGLPEAVEVGDRPAPQRVVVAELVPAIRSATARTPSRWRDPPGPDLVSKQVAVPDLNPWPSRSTRRRCHSRAVRGNVLPAQMRIGEMLAAPCWPGEPDI